MTETEDLDPLAERMKCGKQEAFGEFFDMFIPHIYRMFVLRGEAPADAEELAGDTVSRAMIQIHHYTPGQPSGLLRWVHALAHSVQADRLRDRRRQLAGASHLDAATAVAATGLGPESEFAENAALMRVMDEALGHLAPIDRDIVRARGFGSDVTHKQLAGELGISDAAARQRWKRSRGKLSRALDRRPEVVRWRQRLRGRRDPGGMSPTDPASG